MAPVFTTLRALFYTCCFVVLWGWIALGIRTYDLRLGLVLPSWTKLPGVIVLSTGGLLTLLCVAIFVIRGKGTAAPFDAPRQFVAVGPYRHVRNPMYIGAWIALIGFGLCEHSVSILIFSLAWLLLAHIFVLFVEEPGLEQRFGASYGEYRKSVGRWLPRWQ